MKIKIHKMLDEGPSAACEKIKIKNKKIWKKLKIEIFTWYFSRFGFHKMMALQDLWTN